MMRIICIIVFLQLVSSQRHQNVELEETITTGGCSINVLKQRGRNLRHDSRNTGYMSSGAVRNPPGTHPWEVSVGLDDWRGEWAHYCGGVIVSSNHVVTSANCLEEMLYEGMSITDIHIRAGDDHLKIEPDSFSVQEIRIRQYTNHPEFYSDGDFNYYKNIAVIELEESLRFQDVFVRAIYLPTLEESDTATKHSDTDVSLVIAGRGSWTSQNGRHHSPGGALTDGIIVSFSDIYCNSVYNGSFLSHGFTEDVMCGGGPLDLAGVCYGDDGSGVFKLDHEKERFVLVGILSLGLQYEDEVNCGHKNKPNIFVRTSSRSIINFLYETVYGSSCKNLNVENTDVLPNQEVSQYLYEECGLNRVIEDGYHGVDKNSVWPWLVSLRREMEDPDDHSKVWSHFCSGTILSRTKILAAAQCLRYFKHSNTTIKIRAGDVVVTYNNDDDNAQERLVKNFTIHPKHSSNSYFDVAILDLEIPLTFSFNSVKPICLLSLEESKHITKEDETYLPLSVPVLGDRKNVQQNIVATVFSEATCNRSYPLEKDYQNFLPNLFSEDTLCAGDIAEDQGDRPCFGDSGAGAVYFDQHRNRFVLRATLSQGAHGICGSSYFPNVYVRMGNQDVLQWIFNNTGFIPPKSLSLENERSVQRSSTFVCTTSASRPPSSIKWIITDIDRNIVEHKKSQENITESPEGFITNSSIDITTQLNFKVECEAENIAGKQISNSIQGIRYWSSVQDKIWGDGQCQNIGIHRGGLSLEECKKKCLDTPSCTAINYKALMCDLRGCIYPVPAPQWTYGSWGGYFIQDEQESESDRPGTGPEVNDEFGSGHIPEAVNVEEAEPEGSGSPIFDEYERTSTTWAVLVAGSDGWHNYRHQADVCHAYQVLHKHGVDDDHIIVIMKDDIANNPKNPKQGNIINKPGGPNVYTGVPKDYTGDNVTPQVFLSVLQGDKSGVSGKGSGKVVESGPNDNIFVYFADHGAPGLVAFPNAFLTASELNKTIKKMKEDNKFGRFLFYMEACESGSMFKGLLPNNIDVLGVTASNDVQSSYACYYDSERKTFLGDVFSVKWMEDSDRRNISVWTVDQQIAIVKKGTNSPVSQYGEVSIGNLMVSEFQGLNVNDGDDSQGLNGNDGNDYQGLNGNVGDDYQGDSIDAVHSHEVPHKIIQNIAGDQMEEEINQLMKKRTFVDDVVENITLRVLGDINAVNETLFGVNEIINVDCHSKVVRKFHDSCFNLGKNAYALRKVRVLVNLCESQNFNVNNSAIVEVISNAIEEVCTHSQVVDII